MKLIFSFHEKKCQNGIYKIFFNKSSTFKCNLNTWIRIRILNADPDPVTQ
jgi:hypothetical protein